MTVVGIPVDQMADASTLAHQGDSVDIEERNVCVRALSLK